MRILILTLGSRGDVQPFVALGAALRAKGHDVTVTTGRGFDAMIERQGLKSIPLSVDVRELVGTPEIRRALHSMAGKVKTWRASKAMMRQQMDEMWTIAQAERPDLILYHPKACVAPLLAAALRAIAVPAFLQPAFVPTTAFPNVLLPAADLGRLGNRLSHKALLALMRFGFGALLKDFCRQSPALERAAGLDVLGGYRETSKPVARLHAVSPLLVPRPEDWSEREYITGYWFSDHDHGWKPPPALEHFLDEGPPPFYVGFGSMPAQNPERLTRIVLDALRRTGERGVLAKGWGGLAGAAPSDRVYLLDAVPHDWLFPRCAAVVHHGGAGTTHEALRWGRPSIVCPVFGDQPFWGRRVYSLGAGPAPLRQNKLTASALAEALIATRLPAVVSRAAEIGATLREETGVDNAATVIESELTT